MRSIALVLASWALGSVGLVGVRAEPASGPSAAPSPADAPRPRVPTIDEAIAQAAAAGKPLIVELYADWCGPCRVFEREVLPDPQVQAALREVVFVRYDGDLPIGDEVMRRFDAHRFPYFLAIDRHGVAQARDSGAYAGARGVERFLAWIAEARDAVVDAASLEARVRARPRDVEARLAAARWYARRGAWLAAGRHHAALADAARADVRAEAARGARLAAWKRMAVEEKLALVRRDPRTAKLTDVALATVGSELYAGTRWAVVRDYLRAQHAPDALRAGIYVALAAGARDEALAAAERLRAMRGDPRDLAALAECHLARGDGHLAREVIAQAATAAQGTVFERSLADARARMRVGGGVGLEVSRWPEYTARAWRRLEQHDDVPLRPTPADADEARAKRAARVVQRRDARTAKDALERELAATCGPVAGGARLAHVVVDVASTGAVTATAVLLDDEGSPALRSCVERTLQGASLAGRGGTQTLTVRFGSP